MIKVELLRTAYITVNITGLFVKKFDTKNFRKLLNLRKSWIQRSLSSMVHYADKFCSTDERTDARKYSHPGAMRFMG